ncbi:MAG: response regulator [Deltaproteobacteria bacterium]|nr:response regulator [Deltaproteobacteria bacterium]
MPINKKILLVDDEKLVRAMIADELVSLGYRVWQAASGNEALEIVKERLPDAVILDIVMPGMDGYEVCTLLKGVKRTKHIPVVMLTGLSDKESKHKGLEVGAIDFLNKPVDMLELSIRLRNILKIKEYNDLLKDYSERLEKEVGAKTKELKTSFIDTIYRLTLAAEHKDKCTASHLKRVSHYTAFLASSLGMTAKEREVIFHASPMHDIGKIGIPDRVLLHPGRLSLEEFELMKKHTTIGGKILGGSDSLYIKSAYNFSLCHHEHWDGTGYPNRLSGENIPIEGRIMLVADRYDALRSPRPYKEAFSHKFSMKALSEVSGRSSSKHFDPRIYEIFLENEKVFSDIYDEYHEL